MEKSDSLKEIFDEELFQVDVDDLIDLANAARGISQVRDEEHPVDFLVTPHLVTMMAMHLHFSYSNRTEPRHRIKDDLKIKDFEGLAVEAIKTKKYIKPIFVS